MYYAIVYDSITRVSKAEKLLKQMHNNPLNWRIEQLSTVARAYGLSENRPGSGGSHVTFRAPNGDKVTVPDHRPIRPIYVKLFVRLIEEVCHHE